MEHGLSSLAVRLSGDSLAVFLFLATSALASLYAALTSPPDWRRWFFIAATALFGGGAALWLFAPIALPAAFAWQVITALTLPVTFGFVVVWIGGRRGTTREAAPHEEDDDQPNNETPSATLSLVLKHLRASAWAQDHGGVSDEVALQELADKLALARLHAFGRIGPSDHLRTVPPLQWLGLRPEIRNEEGVAAVPGNAPAYIGLQFDMKRVRLLWPARIHWMAR